MKNSEVILLNKNGTVTRRKEKSLTKLDYMSSEYLMIDTSVDNKQISRNFVLIKSSPLLFNFTTAVVDYQLLASAITYDPMDHVDVLMKPVHVETNSISDLIRLINCIDRISCVNEIVLDDEMCGENIRIEMGYFGVTLYDERGEIYDKYFCRSDPEEWDDVCYAKSVTKVFKDIYSTDIIRKMISHREFLFINDDMTWNIGGMTKNCNMIGIPLGTSYTITLCTEREMVNVCKYHHVHFAYTIHENSKALQYEVATAFNNADYNVVEDISMILEYFLVSYGNYGLSGYNTFFHLEIISHLDFILSMTNLVWNEIYPNDHEAGINSSVDSIIEIELFYKKEHARTIYMNHDSLISLYDFLQIL
jgi:hypothetical protein